MKVKEVIKLLLACDPEAEFQVAKGNGDGCDTCGAYETYDEVDVERINDLETRVVVDTEYTNTEYLPRIFYLTLVLYLTPLTT